MSIHTIPTGSILLYTGDIIPSGFLPCDGRSIHIDLYYGLYEILGDQYGKGSSPCEFNIPKIISPFPSMIYIIAV